MRPAVRKEQTAVFITLRIGGGEQETPDLPVLTDLEVQERLVTAELFSQMSFAEKRDGSPRNQFFVQSDLVGVENPPAELTDAHFAGTTFPMKTLQSCFGIRKWIQPLRTLRTSPVNASVSSRVMPVSSPRPMASS